MFDNCRVLEALEQLRTDAAKFVDASLWTLSDAELIDCLDTLHQLTQTVVALRSHAVRQIDARGIATARGFRTTAGWLRERLRLDGLAAREMVEQAAELDRRPNVNRALAAGSIDARHAAVIADALESLPDDIDLSVVAEAEAVLLDFATQFEPGKLRRLGARILDHVAPEIADEADRIALERSEKRAQRRRGLVMAVPVDGSVRVTGYLTVEDAAIVNAAFDPLCTPHPNDDRSPGQRRADALVDICQLALRTGTLPDNGGEPAQLVVTVPYDVLTTSLQATGLTSARLRISDTVTNGTRSTATNGTGGSAANGSGGSAANGSGGMAHRAPGRAVLDTGERISAEAARRLACDAQILPVVLGGAGQPLDIGRTRRLYGGPIRRALVLRDQGCAFPVCDRPARWCDAHHIVSWADGGATSVANGVLLCRRHHRLVHGSEWTVRLGADKLPEFIPPAHIDLAQRPRRNLYHRRT